MKKGKKVRFLILSEDELDFLRNEIIGDIGGDSSILDTIFKFLAMKLTPADESDTSVLRYWTDSQLADTRNRLSKVTKEHNLLQEKIKLINAIMNRPHN